MKKAGIALIILLIVLGAAGFGALRYISPNEALDLRYDRVPLGQRAIDMARRLSLDLVLTEADINNYGKEALARQPDYRPDVRIDGARFHLRGDRMIADVNVTIKKRIPARLTLTYKLEWRDPDLIAVIEEAKMKSITLPNRYFDDVVIPLGSEVPKLLKVKEVIPGDGKLTIRFQRPSLKDLPLLTE